MWNMQNGRYFQYSPILCCLGNFLLQSVQLCWLPDFRVRVVAWREHLYVFCIWILRELGRCIHLYIFLWFLFCGSEYEDIYWEFLIQKKHGKFLPCLEYWWFCFISGGCSGIFPETRQWVIIMEMCYWICTILLKASYESERWKSVFAGIIEENSLCSEFRCHL